MHFYSPYPRVTSAHLTELHAGSQIDFIWTPVFWGIFLWQLCTSLNHHFIHFSWQITRSSVRVKETICDRLFSRLTADSRVDWGLGASRILTLFDLNLPSLCLAPSSFWKTKLHLSVTALQVSVHSLSLGLYLTPSILPSILTSFPSNTTMWLGWWAQRWL